jgi:hypothetical protein
VVERADAPADVEEGCLGWEVRPQASKEQPRGRPGAPPTVPAQFSGGQPWTKLVFQSLSRATVHRRISLERVETTLHRPALHQGAVPGGARRIAVLPDVSNTLTSGLRLSCAHGEVAAPPVDAAHAAAAGRPHAGPDQRWDAGT